ncbi:MAG TPA: hypothetical protein VF882_05680, partial [Gemmatimonadales bacterium]
GRPGADNMALDEALLLEAGRTGARFLRLYRWDPPCLSLGRNEPALERGGIATVRRPTGGRAVWHEHEVTYAVAAPIAAFGRLRDAYRAIHERLAAALRSLGANVTLAGDRPTARRLDGPTSCFATSVGGEILAHGRKLVGSAQVRHGSAFLQHGSILLDGSQEMVAAVSRKPQAASAATTLSDALGRRVTWEEVAEAIVQTWGDEVTSTALYRPLPPSAAVFSDPAWTWRR